MHPERLRILLIEDNPADVRLLDESLAEIHAIAVELKHADKLRTGLKKLSEQAHDLVLLDLSLPDETGLETVKRMCAENPHLPVIVLTGLEDDELSLEALKVGAQDYLVKGQVDGPGIARAIRYAIERKRLEQRMQHMANYDALTDLPNRRLFQDRMELAIERARRSSRGVNEKWELVIMLLDLDNFKEVNDTLGHAHGDLLLLAVADRLQNSIRKTDTLARMGGDEFTLIFENETGMDDAEILARKIQAVFMEPFQVSDQSLSITASIGISLFPSDGNDPEMLLKYADLAMYRAKQTRNRFCFYADSQIQPSGEEHGS